MKPGDIVSAHVDGDSAMGVVLATNRHKHSWPIIDAREDLAAGVIDEEGWPDHADLGYPFGREQAMARVLAVVKESRPDYWRSVTQREIDDGSHYCMGECEPGSWCADGAGKKWVKVLSVEMSACRAVLEDIDG